MIHMETQNQKCFSSEILKQMLPLWKYCIESSLSDVKSEWKGLNNSEFFRTNVTNVETLTLIQTVWWYTCKFGIKNFQEH